MKSSSKHWDTIFSETEDPKLGWYEKDASQTLKLLNEIPNWEDSTIFLRTGGYAIFAEFSKTGAPKCAGLTLHRYSVAEISDRLGTDFELITSYDHIYINPSGDPRPYIYTLYKRVSW